MNELVNYEAVCRTAPATPGLSIIYNYLEANMKEWLHKKRT